MIHLQCRRPEFTLLCLVVLSNACALSAIVSGETLSQREVPEGSREGDVAGPPRITAEMIVRPPGEIVTVENSPQFAEDYAGIDKLWCGVLGHPRRGFPQ